MDGGNASLRNARAALARGDGQGAAEAATRAIRVFEYVEKRGGIKAEREKAAERRREAEDILSGNTQLHVASTPTESGTSGPSGAQGMECRRGGVETERASDTGSVGAFQGVAIPKISFKDVIGMDDVKNILAEAVILPQQHPDIFTGGREPWRSALIYGPPGTGKSFIARALAGEAGQTFYSISAADIMSKWMGEAEKRVAEIFHTARENRPCIVFFDEVEALMSQRAAGENDAMKRVKTQLLDEIDGSFVDNKGVFIIAATNRPGDLDSAFTRRFKRRLLLDLPTADDRRALVLHKLGNDVERVGRDAVEFVVSKTEGYSVDDISVVVNSTAMMPVTELLNATHFRICNDKWMPCAPYSDGAVEKTWRDIPRGMLETRHVSQDDILSALASTAPSVAPEDVLPLREYHAEYGTKTAH